MPSAVLRKSLLVPPLLLALYLLADDESTGIGGGDGGGDSGHHLAVLTALRRHPPSLRVFRALSELALLLFCTAASLWIWEGHGGSRIGREAVGALLFQPARVGADGIDHEAEEEYEMVFYGGQDDEEDRADADAAAGDGDGGGHDAETGAGDGSKNSEEGDNDGDEHDGNNKRDGGGGFDDVHGDIWHDDRDGAGAFIRYRDHGEAAIKSAPSSSAAAPPVPLPPASRAVAGAALDLLLVVLVCLFLFTLSSAEGGRYIDGIGGSGSGSVKDGEPATSAASSMRSWSWRRIFSYTADVAAPIFPLLLFLLSALRSVLPWSRRREFWSVISRTLMAPYSDVTFRDGFVGDILTSTVRPLQDVAFTTFYVLSGLQGWWRAEYGIDDAGGPVERSWLVHTVVLPGCMVSPLWWRFLQNLRQAHDHKERWPYLGNAFKYFIAAEVALFGVFEPEAKSNVAWVSCFFLATLYQVWWDVFMDWELLVWDDGGDDDDGYVGGGGGGDLVAASSAGPSRSGRRRRCWAPPPLFRFRLRSERLYRRRLTYYIIFVTNFLLRFCWTMTFIPRRYLSRSGMLTDAYSGDFQTFVGPALASAEIVRRSLWGLLRVELEAIKLARKKQGDGTTAADSAGNVGATGSRENNEGAATSMWDEELKPMTIGSSSAAGRGMRRMSDLAFSSVGPLLEPYSIVIGSDMSAMSDMQILGELCLWATAFTSLGILAAAHRHVM